MMKSEIYVCLLVACLFSFVFASCSTQTIYLVRHAEKDTVQKNDPPLTTAGRQRAEDLAVLLRHQPVSGIYSTHFVRTLATAQPTAVEHHLNITLYDSIPQLTALLSAQKNKTVLITGHSNTIIPIAKALGTQPHKTVIGDHEFDNLFIIRSTHFLWLKSRKLQETTYGNPSMPH